MTKMLTVALAAVAVAACSGYGGSKGAKLKVSVAAVGGGGAGTALDGGNGLSMDRIRILVRRISVEGEQCAASTAAAPAEQEDECDVSGGPFLVDLSGADLASGVHWISTLDVPAGTYEESKFVVDTLPAEAAGSDAGLKAMADAHASIIVDGALNGTSFTFSTPIEVAQKREGKIVIDPSTGSNLTLDVDPSGWFKASDGTLLDPGDASKLGAILDNIRASIRLVRDDDEDGVEDSGDGSGGHDGPGETG
jgi:hypothetical protein